MRNWHGTLSPFGKWHTASDDGGVRVIYVLQSSAGVSFVDPQGRLMVSNKGAAA